MIIEPSKEVDPHLDQRVAPLTTITTGLVVLEPEALGGPTGTWPRVSSNPSNIKYQQPKPNHCSGGKESTYIFSAWVHKQRPCMPMAPRTIEGKIRTSYRPQLSHDEKITTIVHFVYTISSRRTMPRNRTKSSKSCGKKTDIGYKPGISFNALNGEIISDLYSDEHEFDANEYQK